MTAQSQVPKLYHSVIDDVIKNVSEAFMDEGVDPSVLTELKQIWHNKLAASKVMESDVAPAPPSAQQILTGPYSSMQHLQQHQQSQSHLHQSQQQQPQQQHPPYQTSSRREEAKPDRPPAVPVSSVPVFTTLSHPGAELSDAASMAYSSILQSAIVQTPNGPMQISPQPAHSGSSATAAAAVASRAALMAAAAQPQYLFAHPGSGGSIIIPHSQAIRLQQQQQQGAATDSQARGGKLPQVDGVIDEGVGVASGEDNVEPSLKPNPAAAASASTCLSSSASSSSSSSRGLLRLSTGESIRGRVLRGGDVVDETQKLRRQSKTKNAVPARQLPGRRRRPRVEIVFQLDGADAASSSDDDDDDDDNDLNDDDDSDKDPDDEEVPGVEEEPLNSEDDVSDNDPEELFDTENVVVCQYERISRVRNKWRFYLKDGIMNIQGKDYVFLKACGEADW